MVNILGDIVYHFKSINNCESQDIRMAKFKNSLKRTKLISTICDNSIFIFYFNALD